jgi:tetratricopeptide (TPR) repeat protein
MKPSFKYDRILFVCFLLSACATEPGIQQPAQQTLQAPQGEALLEQAEAAYQAKNFTEAKAKFEQLIVIYPKIPYMWFKLGNTNMKLQQYENAASAYRHVIALDAHYAKASYNLGIVRLIESEQAFKQARENAPPDSIAAIQANEVLSYSKRLLALLARSENDDVRAANEQKPIDLINTSDMRASTTNINRQSQ